MLNHRKVVIVTGGSQGIGYEIVRVLSECFTVINVDMKEPQEKLPNVENILANLSYEDEICQTLNYVVKRYEVPFAIINNAGISEPSAFADTTLESWQRQLNINLTAPFIMAREFVLHARHDKYFTTRKIINIASVSGMVGMPRYAAYNSSKAGLIELTKTLAVELAPDFHVSAICPGYILTQMQRKEYSDTELQVCASRNPTKRLGAPEEVAHLVRFVLSGENDYLNGSILVMDGGETAGGLAS